MKRKTVVIFVGIISIIAVIAFFVVRGFLQSQAAALNAVETISLERGDLISYVGGTGRVRSNQSSILSWQTTGRVGEVRFKTGDIAKKGEIVVSLAEDSLAQNIILARADLISARRALNDLKKSQVAQANAQLSLARAQKALDDAKEQRESKEYQRSSQSTLDIARANYIIANEAVSTAQQNFEQVENNPEEDVARATAFSALAQVRQQRDRALANLNWLLGLPDSKEVALADANVEVAQANLDAAQREWDRLKNGVDPSDIEAAEAKVTALESTQKLAGLEAPFDGTLTDIKTLVGDQVLPGTISFRLDDLSRLLVDVDIPEVDINQIELGSEVKLTFDAIPEKEYRGEIVKVGRVGTATQGLVNFPVTIEIQNVDENVMTGMTAAVNIVVSKKENVLLVPNRAIRFQNSQRQVYLLRDDKQEPVDIQIGASSDIYSELVSGELTEGDVIILNPTVQTLGNP